jgi:DNA-binding transcriptional MerR regulator
MGHHLSIDELADAAGLTRRGIRFYVQQRLLPTPHGVGRGKHYDASHLARLREIRQLQAAGHSLEEIRHLLESGAAESITNVAREPKAAQASAPPPPPPPALRAELWRRVRVMEGLELSFDAGRFNPSVEQLVALREIIASSFKRGSTENGS